MLTNRSTQLAGGTWMAGIDSCWGGRPDTESALRDVPDDTRAIVLGHEPWLATTHDRHLHVAGHTHHGQVRAPLPLVGEAVANMFYPRYSRPFPRGLYRRTGDAFVYTTAGVGYSTVDWRLNCPPEIVVLDA
jgi:predicted MPP superfamily phosphohydrolase